MNASIDSSYFKKMVRTDIENKYKTEMCVQDNKGKKSIMNVTVK